ncbi:hypothetical protein ZWY2020_023539 [Hordeum vulgare]|nr:hypothetical protein ZWY2020_023539 [Hordeum vulgare]
MAVEAATYVNEEERYGGYVGREVKEEEERYVLGGNQITECKLRCTKATPCGKNWKRFKQRSHLSSYLSCGSNSQFTKATACGKTRPQQSKIMQFIYDNKMGQSHGFGYVTMITVEEAEKAVRTYHVYVIYGSVRPLTVYITTPHQSGCPFQIFVCNLPWKVDDSWLEKLFSTHGKVVDARVGILFVTMATEEQSYYAINSLNKQILEGRTLRVKVSREKPQQGY